MRAIIIGKDTVYYYDVSKKDIDRHFFVVRKQLYKIYPDALTTVDVYQNGAFIGTDSLIVFEENGNKPYHCKYPKDYEDDYILSSIDEHRLMLPAKKGWKGFFKMSKGGWRTLLEFMPWIIIGSVLLFTMVLK